MVTSLPTTRGRPKRGQSTEEATPASVATPSPSAKSKRARTKTAESSPHYSGMAVPVVATKIDPYGVSYPSISATTIKTLKWGDARDLMLPFLTDEEKTNIHKKTRADLSKLLEARIIAGDVTPEQFWAVVGVEKVQQRQKEKKKSTLDPLVAEALLKTKMTTSMGSSPAAAGAAMQQALASRKSSPPQKTTVPAGMPIIGMPYPRPMPMPMPGVSPPMAAGAMPPWQQPPRPRYKYTLRIPASIWPSTNYPPGIVIGEPVPPSPMGPPSISGTFHSSAILAIGPEDKVLDEGDAIEQSKFVFNRLDLILGQLNATHSDILSMSAHVVDINENGKHVLGAQQIYMEGKGKGTKSVCAWSMIGVSGLMPVGCVVQLEVKAVVRRGNMTNLIPDRPPPRQAVTSSPL